MCASVRLSWRAFSNGRILCYGSTAKDLDVQSHFKEPRGYGDRSGPRIVDIDPAIISASGDAYRRVVTTPLALAEGVATPPVSQEVYIIHRPVMAILPAQ